MRFLFFLRAFTVRVMVRVDFGIQLYLPVGFGTQLFPIQVAEKCVVDIHFHNDVVENSFYLHVV